MASLTFGGYDLATRFLVQVDRPVGPKTRIITDEVPGRDGDVVLGVELEPVDVVAHLVLRGRYLADWATVRREVAGALLARGERTLTLPGDDLTYKATATVDAEALEPMTSPEPFDVVFTLHDPTGYGTERSVTVPSGGMCAMAVGGTMPCAPVIDAPAAVRDSSTLLWGVNVDGVDYVRVKLPTSAATHVTIDCATRVVTIGSATSMITLDSDWPRPAPGNHVVTMDKGTGAATVTWDERWI